VSFLVGKITKKMADPKESKPPLSPKSGEPERVTFETQEMSSLMVQDETSSRSPKQDGSVVSQSGANSVDGTSSSWAPRATAADAASASMNSVQSPRRAGKHDKAKQRKNMRSNKGNRNPSDPSLTNSALASTLGILKLAGGVTLSTANTVLLTPSLDVTRKVLLPSLFAGIADYLSQTSPQRLKDWFRILSASVHHLFAVIVSTKRGSTFRHKFVRVGGDIVDVASSDTSRQALMDGMACWVKLYEALQ
jgi:hypothetical protein